MPDESSKLKQKIQYVVDDRPMVLKNLDKTVVDKTVKSLGTYELNRKKQRQSLPYQYNIEGTKYYFSTKSEIMARVLIIFSQLLLISVALIYLPTLAQIVTQLILSLLPKFNISFSGPVMAIGQPLITAVIILLVILWISTLFFITIPILITRTLRTVNIWTIVVSIIGNINCSTIFAMAILQLVYVRKAMVGLNINPFVLPICAIVAYFCFILGSFILRTDRKKYQNKVENEIANQIRMLKW